MSERPEDIKAAEERLRQRRRSRRSRNAPPGDEPNRQPLDSLRALLDSLDAMDRRKGLTGDHGVVGAFRLGAHDEGIYGVTLQDGTEISLGDADKVLNQPRKTKAAIAGAIGVSLTLPRGGDEWDKFFEHLHAAAVPRDATLSRKEGTCEWIASLIREGCVAFDLGDPIGLAQAISEEELPFRDRSDQDRLYLRLHALVRHVSIHVGARTTQSDASQRLAELGFRRDQRSARVEQPDDKPDKIIKGRFWASPLGFDPDDDPAVPTSPPLSLSDQSVSSVGTWGRGDVPTNGNEPHKGQRGHVGTRDHETDRPLSNKGDHNAESEA